MHLFWFKSHLSFLPDDCVSFSVSTMWAGRNSLCSVPLHAGIKEDISTDCFMMRQKPLVKAGGELTIIEDCPNGKDGITGSHSFSSRNFSLPKKQEGSQQRWLSQRLDEEQSEIQSVCRSDSAGLPSWGWTYSSVNQPEHFITWNMPRTRALICLWQWTLIIRYHVYTHSLIHTFHKYVRSSLYMPNYLLDSEDS